jgi:BASS family bile acid:Na+ symporter
LPYPEPCQALPGGRCDACRTALRAAHASIGRSPPPACRALTSVPRRLARLARSAAPLRQRASRVGRVAAVTSASSLQKTSDFVTNLFPVWTVLSAALALTRPAMFSAIDTKYFTAMLAALMLSMGITLTIKDFQDCLTKPVPVALNFICCYLLMPGLAFAIGTAMQLSGPLMAGLVLVGSINGGQASNLCTYIAKGDVALSVVMTTSTTLGCIFMTPLIAKAVLGTIVPVDPIGIAVSTIQVVLLPVLVGVIANAQVPKVCRAVEPFCPLVGVAATVLLVGASVAQCSADILAAGLALQWPLVLLHLVGGVAGYWLPRLAGQPEKTCRTVAIETSMKSSAFGFLLASLHFGNPAVRVPSAISVVWMAVMGATMAVYWRFVPITDE